MHGHERGATGRPGAGRGTPALRPATEGRPAAVAWIDRSHAVVARTEGSGERRLTVRAGSSAEGPYLARVVDAIGDRERVLILGSDPLRVALEREYVAIHHRPERLVDVELAAPVDGAELDRRLATLSRG